MCAAARHCQQPGQGEAFNYILVRGLPGPNEDPGTLLATVSPTSITASAGSGLIDCQGVFPAV